MVLITYDCGKFELTAQGHAGAAPVGEDLVCAAVTMLVRTFAENAKLMDRAGIASGVQIELEDGSAHVLCRPAKKYRAVAKAVLQAVCIGFELLEQEFPEHVRFRAIE